jgi:RNA polymerase sigma factor (sigma-70 family)
MAPWLLNDPTPSNLLRRLRARGDEARGQLVAVYGRVVVKILAGYRLDRNEREDLGQAFWLTVFAKFDQFSKETPGDTLRGWLRALLRNLVRDRLRKRRKDAAAALGGSDHQRLMGELPDREPPTDDLEERREMLRVALELVRPEVSPRDFENFRRSVMLGEPVAEVAKASDMKPEAVRMANARVRQKLRQKIGELWE